MTMGVMRMLTALAMAAVLPIAIGGCQKKGAYPSCKNDVDCRVDATGAEINGICYMGKCEECAKDTDCTDLKQCVNNRCLSACQADADCVSGNHCENSYCIADCSSDESCGSGSVCAQGRCMAQGSSFDRNSWATGECKGLERVHFDFDKYDVRPQHREQVSQLARCLESNLSFTVTIEGHTDDRGTPSYNMALGQRRADAVASYLKSNWGIASNRIRTISLGEQQPAVKESNEYAWQQNRRAEFILSK
jgi:peptidoglycan-associated lipoprotein